ncbi:MAG: hypothetical protein NC311_03285 [Muribaculaceae bacterium]|nr:hypothetical protein [Muribaculaceae bacterium]
MEKQEIRTFGRRHGKKLSARQTNLIENILPAIAPDTDGDILEIGFGAGEHVRDLARANPDKIIIGAEPFMNGVASLLSAITDTDNNILDEYKNIRIWPDDVRIMLRNIPTLRFSEIWILHPDPWPKAKHEKRRLLNSDFLSFLSAHLAQNGQIIIGTDHWEYFDWILAAVSKTNLHATLPDIATIRTRYQSKNMAHTAEPKYLILTANATH